MDLFNFLQKVLDRSLQPLSKDYLFGVLRTTCVTLVLSENGLLLASLTEANRQAYKQLVSSVKKDLFVVKS